MPSPVFPARLMAAPCTGWRLSTAVSLEGCLFTIYKHPSFHPLTLRICLLKMSFHFPGRYILFYALKKKIMFTCWDFLGLCLPREFLDKGFCLVPLLGASSFPLLQGLCASFPCVGSTFALHCSTGSTSGEALQGAAGIF